MYQTNPSNKNLGILPPPSFGGQGRKRARETLFPQTTHKYELPSNDMVPNQFFPPPVPSAPSVRLGFNAYEQQAVQKRVCFNSEPVIHPGYGYGGISYGTDNFQNELCNQQNPLTPNDHYNQLNSNFFAANNQTNANYPITSLPNQNMITSYNALPSISSNACSSNYQSPVYPYQHVKENTDPNIPRPSRPIAKFPHNSTAHKTEPNILLEPRAEARDHQLTRGLQLITVNPEAISRWIPLLENFNILFEVFGCFIQQPTPFSLTGNKSEESTGKMFYIKSPHCKFTSIQPNSLKCVYWEIESPIVSTQFEKIYRIIGSYDTRNSYLKAFDIRAAKMDEVSNWSALVARSNRLLRKMPVSLFEA